MEQTAQNEKFINVNLMNVYKKFQLTDEIIETLREDDNNPYKDLMHILSEMDNKEVMKMFIILQFTKERAPTNYLAQILRDNGQPFIADKIVEFNKTEQLFPYTYGKTLEIRRMGTKRSTYTGVFPMDSDPRGVVLIVVNELALKEEAEQMAYLFHEFHFKVQIVIDITAEEIKDLFKETANFMANNKELNAVITIAIGHGMDDMFLGRDYDSGNINDKIELYELVNIFSEKNCPELSARPKVHIFNCCRIKIGDPNQSGDRPVPRNPMIKFRDRLLDGWTNTNINSTVIYSCAEGQRSWFAPDMPGFTYFGRALTHTFAQFACQYHLDRLMTQVNYRLRMDERPVPEYPEVINYKKMWDIYFNP